MPIDQTHRVTPSQLDELPTFDLDCTVDDVDHPSEVTVYSPWEGDVTTHWLSIDLAHAVDLADVA